MTGSKRALRPAGSRLGTSSLELMKRRLAVLQDELQQLVELNRVSLQRVVDDASVANEIFAARFDKTDPLADACQAPRTWKGKIQGDFYLVRRLGKSIFFIVGDATGHHAHAGGLKLFAITALVRIFNDFAPARVLPKPIEIVEHLDRWFSAPPKRMAKEANLRGGTNVTVIRVDSSPRTVTYASAGLPVHALGKSFAVHGSFDDFNGVSFQADARKKRSRDVGKIEVEDVHVLAIVTDGFRSLGRRTARLNGNNGGRAKSIEQFRDQGVHGALQQGYMSSQSASSLRAGQIAETLTEGARRFRSGCYIPEAYDDHRLVLVVDLDAIWRIEASDQGDLPLSLAQECQEGVLELRRTKKVSGS